MAEHTFDSVSRDLRAGAIAPVYYLCGEESYYIDRLGGLIVQAALAPEEQDFNLDVLYGGDTAMERIVERARTYPMMAARRVVMVREAQQLRSLEGLEAYLQHITPTTVLVFCHKGGKLDARKSVSKLLAEKGVVFESKRVYDNQLPAFIGQYLRAKGSGADEKAVQMLVASVGADLNRMASELDKLLLALPKGQKVVTADMVSALTGMSKDFNAFELCEALARKDILKANQILAYFRGNPRGFALQQVLSNLFTFFSDLFTAFYAPQKTEQGVADFLSRPRWKVKQEIMPAMQNYGAMKVLHILAEIRKTDAASKGVGGCKTPHGELLQELVFFILH